MQNKVYGLNINLSSLHLNQDLFHNNDKIRVSITTLPDGEKQNFKIIAKDIEHSHHLFNVNISLETTKIIFVFRRKNFWKGDNIIAATAINESDFPKSINDPSNKEIKNIAIIEPSSKIYKPHLHFFTPKIRDYHETKQQVGKMMVQLEYTDPYQTNEILDQKKCLYSIYK